MKSQGPQNQAFSGCGEKYFPVWAGKILPPPHQNPVVAPAGSALRVWLSQALEFGRSRPGDRSIGTIVEGNVLGCRRSTPETSPGQVAPRGFIRTLWEQTQLRLNDNVGRKTQ